MVSQIPASLAFAVDPAAVDAGDLPVPWWVFVVVWTIIHPSMGVAAWLIWRRRDQGGGDPAVALAMLGVGYLQTLTFWLTDSLRGIAAADATGMLLAVATWWVATRYSRAGARWLLPWVIWMPITLGLKIAAIAGIL